MDDPKNGVQEPGDDAGQNETAGITQEQLDLIEQGKAFAALQEKYPKINFEELPKAFTQATQRLAEVDKPKSEPNDPLEVAMKDFSPEDKRYFTEKILPIIDIVAAKKADMITGAKLKEFNDNQDITREVKDLEKKYDGSNGLPKFDAEAVMKYAEDMKIFNLDAAYQHMNMQSIVEQEVQKTINPKRHFSEGPGDRGGIKMPSGKKLSFKDNTVRDAVMESLERASETE